MLTLDDLRAIMRASAGVDESVDIDGDIENIPFEDLGYDSLAILEISAQISTKYGVLIDDDAAKEMTTPQETLNYVNKRLAA
jgi:minimal PKS acyl carrier protein